MRQLRHAIRARHDERGVVAVWVALLLVVFMGFTAWAVDFSHWNDERTHMQKAADAAALAGAVYLPDDPAGAVAAAKDVAAQNGYPSGVSAAVLSSSLQLKVTISKSVKNSFGQVIGVGSTNLSKQAVSEYESPKPVDLVLILDRTGSMNTPSPATFQNVKDATLSLLGYLEPRTESIALGVLGPSDTGKTCSGANAGAYGLPSSSDVAAPGNTWMMAPYPLAAPANNYQNSNGTLNTSSQIVKTVNCLTTANRTDLGDPIAAATSYLAAYGRPGSKRGIILMTDGAANLPGGTQPCSYANDKATAAKAAGIQVLTIAFLSGSNQCVDDTSGAFKGAQVSKVLASMASPVKGVPAQDNGCDAAENADGDNFFCQPKSGDLSTVFLQAAAQFTGRLPRIVQ
ncbi:MAG: vWA domain-containing protein [Acidimicrobiia bacterium]